MWETSEGNKMTDRIPGQLITHPRIKDVGDFGLYNSYDTLINMFNRPSGKMYARYVTNVKRQGCINITRYIFVVELNWTELAFDFRTKVRVCEIVGDLFARDIFM